MNFENYVFRFIEIHKRKVHKNGFVGIFLQFYFKKDFSSKNQLIN